MAISSTSAALKLASPAAFTSAARRTALSPPQTLSLSTASTFPRSFTASASASASKSSPPQCFFSNLFSSIVSPISSSSTTQNHHRHNQYSTTTTTAASSPPTPTESTQTFHVYELNEGDRHSPAFLKLAKTPEKCLGDLVTFSNKLYSGDLKTRFGISAGMIMFIENNPADGGDRYEAIYSFYFGSYGHISAQGPYFSTKDSDLVITGGTGIFEGARGKARISNVIYPLKLYYVFELKGLKGTLPKEVVGGDPVKPAVDVKAAPDAKDLVIPSY